MIKILLKEINKELKTLIFYDISSIITINIKMIGIECTTIFIAIKKYL